MRALSGSVTRSRRTARRLCRCRTLVVGIVVDGNRAAYAVDAIAFFARGTRLASAGAGAVATNVIHAVRIEAFIAEVTATAVGFLGHTLVRVAVEAAGALRIERTRRQTRTCLARIRHAGLLDARQTRPDAVAELRQITRNQVLTRSRHALRRHRIVFTSRRTVAETRLPARRRAIRCAFVVRIRSRNDGTANTVAPVALLERRASLARIGARVIAANRVDALPGRTFQSRQAARAVRLRSAFATRTNRRLAIRAI